jgi:hypothetical protein
MVDVLTGLNSDVTGTLSTIGLLTSPIVINMSTTVGDRNAVGGRRITTGISVRSSGPKGSENVSAPSATTRAGRLSWRELENYDEMRKTMISGGK